MLPSTSLLTFSAAVFGVPRLLERSYQLQKLDPRAFLNRGRVKNPNPNLAADHLLSCSINCLRGCARPNSRPAQRAAVHELPRRPPRGQGGRVLPPGVKDRRRPPRGEAPALRFGARRGCACVGAGAALPRRAAGDPPPLRAHQGDAAPGRSLPLRVLPLGPPAGRRRGCGLAPRRAQPAPLLRLAAAGHLRPQKVRPSPLVAFPEFEIRRSE